MINNVSVYFRWSLTGIHSFFVICCVYIHIYTQHITKKQIKYIYVREVVLNHLGPKRDVFADKLIGQKI